ncbi:MAG: pilus assembly protein N-terminal domain-containing protein, partial [Planctomycetota bacterium]
MYANFRNTARARWLVALVGLALTFVSATTAIGQTTDPKGSVDFHVGGPSQRLEMVVNTSRILTLDKEIPRVLVNNQDVLRVVPLAPTKVQVSALQPGVTQVNLWEKDGEVRTVDVVVFADARQLELVLQSEFPKAAIRVRPLASSVVLTGYVDRPEVVGRIVRIAEDYYPQVINNISVGGVQQVALHVRVMEVSRTKLRALGTDWGLLTGDDFVIQSAAGLISAAASGATG